MKKIFNGPMASTSVSIPGELLRRAKEKAASEGRSMSDLVREALERYLMEAPTAPLPSPAKPPP